MRIDSRLAHLVVSARQRVSQMNETRRQRAVSEGALRREVLRLALPATGEQLLSMTVSIVDTMLVGHLGASALAAVSLATQWTFMAVTLFAAVSTGATALVARSVGAGDWATANRTVRQSMLVGLAIGLTTTALALPLARPAVALMGAEPEALEQGVVYLRVAGSIFGLSALMFVGNACLRGAGDTRTTMMVMAVVNVLNITVAWTAINGPFGLPKLGVAGSALGAAVGRAAGGLLVITILLRGRSGLKLDLRGWRLDLALIRRVLRVGLPAGVEQMTMRFGMMAFVRVIAGLGTVAVAAHTVALRAESFSFMPGFGFAVAGTTLVGQGLGARDPKRAERSGYITFQLALTLMTVMGLIFIFFPRPLISLFTDDPDVIRMAVVPLRIVGFVQPLLAGSMVFAGNLRGAGDTRFPMYITGGTIWTIRVPAALLLGLHLGMGLTGAWLGMATDLACRGTIFFLRFRSGHWKQIKV
ncbi:MAG: MATE family efflux transporter [Chloroflexota bacterium]